MMIDQDVVMRLMLSINSLRALAEDMQKIVDAARSGDPDDTWRELWEATEGVKTMLSAHESYTRHHRL